MNIMLFKNCIKKILPALFFLLIILCSFAAWAANDNQKWFEDKNSKLMQAQKYTDALLRSEKKAAAPEKRWLLFGKTGFEYDDNVPLASSHKALRTPNQNTNAFRYTMNSGFSYDLYRDHGWRSGVAYAYTINLHDDDLNAFNFQNHETTAYALKKMTAWGRGALLQLRYTFSYGVLDRHSYSSSNYWSGAWTGEYAQNLLVTFYERLGASNFRDKGFDPSISSRDGFYQQTGITQTFLFDKRRRSFALGYEFSLGATEGNNFDEISNAARAVFSTPLIEKINFESSFFFKADDYNHFVQSPKRFDLNYQYEFRLSRPIGTHWKVSTFYRRTDVRDAHDHSLGQYSYRRNVGGMELSFVY